MAGSLIGISLLFGVTVGAYASYEVLRPKNIGQYLEWKGYRLIKDDLIWKAVYEEYLGEFKDIQELKSYCSKALSKSELSELDGAIKYCVDEVRTVKGQLIREGIINKLIKTEEEYKLALVLRSENKEFLEIVDSVAKYKEWCESNLNRKPNPTLITNVKSFCIPKPYKIAKEKLENEGFKRLTKAQLRLKFNELQISKLESYESNTLLADIGGNDGWIKLKKDIDLFTNAYWDWCEKEATRSLVEEGYYPKGYAKFRSRCGDIEKLKVVWRKTEEIRKTNPLVQEVLDFEKANSCDIYFAHLRETNSYFKVDDPFWAENKDILEYDEKLGKRDLYEGFAELVRNPRTKDICKELNGKRYLVAWQWDEKVWS